MMPVIRISDATWEALKEWAVPLEDNPDTVVSRLIEIAKEHKGCSSRNQLRPIRTGNKDAVLINKRLPKGVKVSNTAYQTPILEALYELGGKGYAKEVLDIVERKIQHLLNDVDYESLPQSGEIRWRNTAQWARRRLVEGGFLRDDSERGLWELSKKGIEEVEKDKSSNP